MDVSALVHALGRAEWGPLAGPTFRGARIVLDALAQIMHSERRGRSASTVSTARQIAQRSGYSYRWTRDSLKALESVGILEWERGGVFEGEPTPSRFRIVKKVLCDWIEAARAVHDERAKRLIAETRARLRMLRQKTISRPFRRSRHAEVASTPPPYKGRRGATCAAPRPTSASDSTPLKENIMPIASTPDLYLPLICPHGTDLPRTCNRCRSRAWADQHEAERKACREARMRAAEAAQAEEEIPAWSPAAEAYLLANYGDNPRAWARAALTDPKVKEIERANA